MQALREGWEPLRAPAPGLFDAEPPGHLTTADPVNWPAAADWAAVLQAFWASETGQKLQAFLTERLAAGATIYPPEPLTALALTPLADVRVVVIGQDPYHGPGQAEGLAFSVARGVALPPSLRNVFKERARDLGVPPPGSKAQPQGSLRAWAGQGVLLLNTSLTVEAGRPASHAAQGWAQLTDALVRAVAQRGLPCVYLLWGGHAQAKAALIDAATPPDSPSLVLCANHPSPLAALRPPQAFVGCGHFGTAQRWLQSQNVSVRF